MTDQPEPRTLREEIMAGLPLNEHELQVLDHAARGRNARETGGAMYIAEETVKSYRKRIIAKLASRNLTHAVAIAIGMGYVNIEPVVDEHEARMAAEQGGQ